MVNNVIISLNRMLLVLMLSAILPPMLLPLLEREGVFRAQTRLHQAIHQVAAWSAARDATFVFSDERSHPCSHLTILLWATSSPRAVEVQDQSRLDFSSEARPRILHPLAHLLLLAGLLPEHAAVGRLDRVGVSQRLLLLSPHLFPAKECHVWGHHRRSKGRDLAGCRWHRPQEHLRNDQCPDSTRRLPFGWLRWEAILAKFARFGAPSRSLQHGSVPPTALRLSFHLGYT